MVLSWWDSCIPSGLQEAGLSWVYGRVLSSATPASGDREVGHPTQTLCCAVGKGAVVSAPEPHTLSLILPELDLQIPSEKFMPQAQAADSSIGHELCQVG